MYMPMKTSPASTQMAVAASTVAACPWSRIPFTSTWLDAHLTASS
jgi:hypothetical protein